MKPSPQGHTIATVERAADVLNAFTDADGDTLGVTQIADELQLSKAVVHRILASLRTRGFVEIDEESRRYSLGPAALGLGLTYLQKIDVRDLARPLLRDLSDATNETATLSIRRGMQRMYIDQVTPDREVKMIVQLGHPYPLHAGGSSKCFLAHLPPDVVDEYLAGPLESMTPSTESDPATLRRQLAEIRSRGYSLSLGERQPGAGSLASPIFDHQSEVAAVMSVCGPIERFSHAADAYASLLLGATAKLSRKLGHKGDGC